MRVRVLREAFEEPFWSSFLGNYRTSATVDFTLLRSVWRGSFFDEIETRETVIITVRNAFLGVLAGCFCSRFLGFYRPRAIPESRHLKVLQRDPEVSKSDDAILLIKPV